MLKLFQTSLFAGEQVGLLLRTTLFVVGVALVWLSLICDNTLGDFGRIDLLGDWGQGDKEIWGHRPPASR